MARLADTWRPTRALAAGAVGAPTLCAVATLVFRRPASHRLRIRRSTRRYSAIQGEAATASEARLDAELLRLRGQVTALQAELRRKDRELRSVRPRTAGPDTAEVLHIFHFNDVYNINELSLPTFCSDDRVGGALRFKTLVDGVARERSIRPMLVFSGDFVAPSLTSIATFGRHMVEAFNLLGVDFGCFGNHDLDYGLEPGPRGQGLRAILKERLDGRDDRGRALNYFPASKTRWLSSNMLEADGAPLAGASKTIIKDWCSDPTGEAGSVRVGLFSVTYDWRSPENPCGLRYLSAVDEARRCVAELREKGAQVVLAVTHLPLSGGSDSEPSDEQLMRECPGIDLLLGGHDHFYLYDHARNIVKSGSDFRHLSHIQVRLEGGRVASTSCERFDVTRGIPANAEMAALVEKYDRLNVTFFGRIVARTSVELDSREQAVRFGESRLMNFVADAAASLTLELAGGAAAHIDGVDACVLEACCVFGEQVLPSGDVRMKDLRLWFTAAGDLVRLVVIELTADELKAHLERGMASLPLESWALLHVSGALAYEGDLSQPSFNRILQMRLGDEVLYPRHEDKPPRKLRCVVTTNFARWCAPAATQLIIEDGAVSLMDVVLRRLEAIGEIDGSCAPLGRIRFHEGTPPGGVRALGAPRSGLPAVSSDFDASRELYRNADAVLGLQFGGLRSQPVIVGTNNFSKMLRMAEVFGGHQIRVESAPRALPYQRRLRLASEPRDVQANSLEDEPGEDSHLPSPLSQFERDCVGKAFAYAPGVLVTVAGLCIEPRSAVHRSDQWFFADDTPVGTAIYLKDRIGWRDSVGERFHFRPSRNLSEFAGKKASLSVLFARIGSTTAEGVVKCDFYDGGTIHGRISAPRGVNAPAPCLPYEYVFLPHDSGGRTLAEVRGEAWDELVRQQQPRVVDDGPYAAAARRFVTGVPSWSRTLRAEVPAESCDWEAWLGNPLPESLQLEDSQSVTRGQESQLGHA